MVVHKHILNSKRSTAAFHRALALGRYVLDLDSPVPERKCSHRLFRNLLLAHRGPEMALHEMAVLATANFRCPDPISHHVISWPAHERPTPQQLEDIADLFLREAELQGHQLVGGYHIDRDNAHFHLAVNRIHPRSLRAPQINGGKTRWFGAAFACLIEQRHGFSAEPQAAAYWIEDQARPVLSDLIRRGPAPAVSDRDHWLGTSAASMIWDKLRLEHLRWQNWRDAHAGLALHGLEIMRRGRGLVIGGVVDASSGKPVFVAGSRVAREFSLTMLERRFGTFEPDAAGRFERMRRGIAAEVFASPAPAPSEGPQQYIRQSAPPANTSIDPEPWSGLIDSLRAPQFRILYEKPGQRRFGRHMIDRARGDGTALRADEARAFAPNVAALGAKGFSVSLWMPMPGDMHVVRASPDSMTQLEDAGMTASVRIEHGPESIGVFRLPDRPSPALRAGFQRAMATMSRHGYLAGSDPRFALLPVAGPDVRLERARRPRRSDFLWILQLGITTLTQALSKLPNGLGAAVRARRARGAVQDVARTEAAALADVTDRLRRQLENLAMRAHGTTIRRDGTHSDPLRRAPGPTAEPRGVLGAGRQHDGEPALGSRRAPGGGGGGAPGRGEPGDGSAPAHGGTRATHSGAAGTAPAPADVGREGHAAPRAPDRDAEPDPRGGPRPRHRAAGETGGTLSARLLRFVISRPDLGLRKAGPELEVHDERGRYCRVAPGPNPSLYTDGDQIDGKDPGWFADLARSLSLSLEAGAEPQIAEARGLADPDDDPAP